MYQKQKLTCVEGTKCSAFDVFSVAMVTVNFLGMASYSLFIKSIQVYNQFFVNTTVVPCMRRTLYQLGFIEIQYYSTLVFFRVPVLPPARMKSIHFFFRRCGFLASLCKKNSVHTDSFCGICCVVESCSHTSFGHFLTF